MWAGRLSTSSSPKPAGKASRANPEARGIVGAGRKRGVVLESRTIEFDSRDASLEVQRAVGKACRRCCSDLLDTRSAWCRGRGSTPRRPAPRRRPRPPRLESRRKERLGSVCAFMRGGTGQACTTPSLRPVLADRHELPERGGSSNSSQAPAGQRARLRVRSSVSRHEMNRGCHRGMKSTSRTKMGFLLQHDAVRRRSIDEHPGVSSRPRRRLYGSLSPTRDLLSTGVLLHTVLLRAGLPSEMIDARSSASTRGKNRRVKKQGQERAHRSARRGYARSG